MQFFASVCTKLPLKLNNRSLKLCKSQKIFKMSTEMVTSFYKLKKIDGLAHFSEHSQLDQPLLSRTLIQRQHLRHLTLTQG